MPKITLNLDDIKVESYSTGSAEPILELMIPTTNSQDPDCTRFTRCDPIMC